MDTNTVIAKYLQLRDRKAEMSARQEEELKPLNAAMQTIETWLLDQANKSGVKSFRTEAGTAFKVDKPSVKLTDEDAFKAEVFSPAIEGISHYLIAKGYILQAVDLDSIKACLLQQTKWDMVDFRAGKKGILEHLEQENTLPAGVDMTTMTVMQIRRS